MVQFKLEMIFTNCKEIRKAITRSRRTVYKMGKKYCIFIGIWVRNAGRHENDCLLVANYFLVISLFFNLLQFNFCSLIVCISLKHACGPEEFLITRWWSLYGWPQGTWIYKIKSNPKCMAMPIHSLKDQFQDGYNCGASDMNFYGSSKEESLQAQIRANSTHGTICKALGLCWRNQEG